MVDRLSGDGAVSIVPSSAPLIRFNANHVQGGTPSIPSPKAVSHRSIFFQRPPAERPRWVDFGRSAREWVREASATRKTYVVARAQIAWRAEHVEERVDLFSGVILCEPSAHRCPCPLQYPQKFVPHLRVTRRYEFPPQSPAVANAGGPERESAFTRAQLNGHFYF
jgi:hypothetical protein